MAEKTQTADAEAIPDHTDVGLHARKFRCTHCGEVVEKPPYKNIEDEVDQHITYHCTEVGLLHQGGA